MLGLTVTTKRSDRNKAEKPCRERKDNAPAIAGSEIDSEAGKERSEQGREARGSEKYAEQRTYILKAEIFDQHTRHRGDAAAIADAKHYRKNHQGSYEDENSQMA